MLHIFRLEINLSWYGIIHFLLDLFYLYFYAYLFSIFSLSLVMFSFFYYFTNFFLLKPHYIGHQNYIL